MVRLLYSCLIALLALCTTTSSNAFTTTVAPLRSERPATSLAVLRDFYSTRTLQENHADNEDDDDDDDDNERMNIRQTLSFTELLQTTRTVSSLNNKKKQQHSRFVAEADLPTNFGLFRMRGYAVEPAHPVLEPCVIYAADKPPFGSSSAVPVRIHDQCLTSEVFGSLR